MGKPQGGPNLNRRGLLRGAAAAAPLAAAAPFSALAGEEPSHTPPNPPQAPRPSAAAPPNVAYETTPRTESDKLMEDPGSDFMCDVIKNLGIDHIAANPSAAMRGLHESLINYLKIDYHTCTHEEQAVAMCHAYAKTAGKPMLTMSHGTVGLQHAAMALYNAWADQAPLIAFAGDWQFIESRGSIVDYWHSAIDPATVVRDFVKWDDKPATLQHFAESLTRAYKIAMTPPYGPVLIVVDADLQEAARKGFNSKEKLEIPKKPDITPPIGDLNTLDAAAKLLVNAQNPVIVAGRHTFTQEGIDGLVALAEVLQCPVIDQGSRMNFPSRHPLAMRDRGRPLIGQADVILALETDVWGLTHQIHDDVEPYSSRTGNPNAKIIAIVARDTAIHANMQDYGRYADEDISISASSQATVPYLTEAVKRLLTATNRSNFEARGKRFGDQHNQMLEAARNAALFGWEGSPISTARMCMETYAAIEGTDWGLAGGDSGFISGWPQRLWDMSKPWHNIGGSGAAGLGYGPPATAGAAVANKAAGRITVAFQTDGDCMYTPGAFWTCAHSHLPALYVMHNNRAYHQELMTVQRMANRRNRGIDRAHIGCEIDNPPIDFAQVAKGMGMASFGTITDPKDLGPALKKAVEIVKKGEPCLVDVHTQGR
jgi:thiamine pyrophosphate-dependent acetolactate synthase large subunit-like protein